MSNWRWIIGAKLGFVLNDLGLVCAWDCNLASVADNDFRPLVAQFADEMMGLVGTGFHGHAFDPVKYEDTQAGHVEHAHDD